jgi:predicted nucleic acid-binding protein
MQASLVDTNVLVYGFDPRDPGKQRIARRLLSDGLIDGRLVLPHQAIVEFVAAVTRPRRDLGDAPLLTRETALRESEALMRQFPVLYPDEQVLVTALRGAAAYGLAWFDAHLWAYAEVHGLPEILSEDFEHGRHLGSVRTVDPFLTASGTVAELPAMYDEAAR